jgi:hypothetical protein
MKVFKHKKPHEPLPKVELNCEKIIKEHEEKLKPIRDNFVSRVESGETTIEEAEKQVKRLYQEAYQDILRQFGKPEMTEREFDKLYYHKKKVSE